MIHCTRCNLPETYETIEFDDTGVCNICRGHETKRALDWGAREAALLSLCAEYRGRSGYDCLVPFSGGKDSTYTLWYVVRKLGLKALAVQFDHGFMRPGVLRNNERSIKKLGCELHRFTPSWSLVRRVMLESLIRKGDFCWHCHTGIFAYPMHVALKERVPLIIWGEPSAEYTAYYEYGQPEEVDQVRFDRFINLGITAEDMAGMIKRDTQFDYRDLKPFTYPHAKELRELGVRSICLGSYIPWDVKEQTRIIQDELGWEGDQVEGMPTLWPYEKIECSMQGVRDYIKWLKRGYSRVSQMCALDIRNGRMELGRAKVLIGQYEGVRPASLDLFLDYLGISEAEFNTHVAATAVYPHEPNFLVPQGDTTHDFDEWYRECSKSG